MRYLTGLSVILLLAGLFGCMAPQQDATSHVEYLNSEANKALNLPFSEAVRVGKTLYLSGQIATIPGQSRLIEGGIREETQQVLDNIRAVLQRHGGDIDNVVKCTVFLADIRDYSDMNAVYRNAFKKHFPARSTVAGAGLALGARVEIEAIAVLP